MRVKLIPLMMTAVLLGLAVTADAQVTTLWERSRSNANMPTWFGANTERGMGAGVVDGNERMYVASRSEPIAVRIVDAETGDDFGNLSMTGVSGGYLGLFPINAVDVSDDGKIFATNMVLDASQEEFRVWMWEDEEAEPMLLLAYTGAAMRLGDKFSVAGSLDDRTLTMYAASSRDNRVIRWLVDEDGETFTTEIITLEGVTDAGIQPSVGPKMAGADSEFFFNGSEGIFGAGVGIDPIEYDPDGDLMGTIENELRHTNSIRYFEVGGRAYIATYDGGDGELNAKIYDVTGGADNATFFAETPSLGDLYHEFESGDVSVVHNGNGTVNLYVLAGNNGIGAYQIDVSTTAEGTYYVGAPGTAPGGENPDFASLNAAFAMLADAELNGAVNLLITSDLDETGHDIFVNNLMFTEEEPLTIRPAPGVEATVRVRGVKQAGTESGNAGLGFENIHWMIIDGSNEAGGMSRNLTIMLDDAEAGANGIISITKDSRYVTIQNLNIEWESAVSGVAGVRMRRDNDDTVVPEHITIRNNAIGTPENTVSNGVVKFGTDANRVMADVIDNDIYASQRGVTTFWVRNSTYDGNRVWVRGQRQTASWHAGIYLALASDITIRRNEFLELRSNNEARQPAAGVLINLNLGEVNIYNNIIAVPEFTNEGPGTENPVYGIGVNNAGGTGVHNIHHNTIRIGSSDQTGRVAGFGLDVPSSAQTYVISNNIIVVDHDAENAYAIHWPSTLPAESPESDYNNLYVSGLEASVGNWRGQVQATLSDWQSASDLDDNSVSVDVEFESETDLRLAGASLEDQNLRGTEIPWITEDLDGNERRLSAPFMGAFEPPFGVSVEEPIAERPTGFELHQNYPNPFNPTTNISYTLHTEGHVQVAVYDLQGRLVEQLFDGFQASGKHEVRFDGSNLASGVYLYRVIAGEFVQTKRMTLVK